MDSPVGYDIGGRNYIIYGTFHMKRAEYKEFQKQVVVALFGRPATSGGGGGGDAVPAQLQVYKSNHNPQSPSSNSKLPCYSINLESSTITAAPIAKKTSHYKFSLTDADEGKSYEFKTNHECDYKVWVNRLKFLTKFPYSSIPDSGLKYDHPMGFDKLLDSKLYNTDSVWPVHVLPEEIGSRCSITGPMVLALLSQNKTSPKAILKIYGLRDHRNPVISCDHDMIRRTGMLGLFLYFELGTRCRGGPGLLWMHFGRSKENGVWMKEVLYEFLLRQRVLPQRRPGIVHPELHYNKGHRSSVPTLLPSQQQQGRYQPKNKKHQYQEIESEQFPQQLLPNQQHPPKDSPKERDSSVQSPWKHTTQQRERRDKHHQYEFISTAWKQDFKKERSMSESTRSSWRHSYHILESMPGKTNFYHKENESTHHQESILEQKEPTSSSLEHTDCELKSTSPSHDYTDLQPLCELEQPHDYSELEPTSPSHNYSKLDRDYSKSKPTSPSHDYSELEPDYSEPEPLSHDYSESCQVKPTSPELEHDYSKPHKLKSTSPSHDYNELEPSGPTPLSHDYSELEPTSLSHDYRELEPIPLSHDYRELEPPISTPQCSKPEPLPSLSHDHKPAIPPQQPTCRELEAEPLSYDCTEPPIPLRQYSYTELEAEPLLRTEPPIPPRQYSYTELEVSNDSTDPPIPPTQYRDASLPPEPESTQNGCTSQEDEYSTQDHFHLSH